MTPQTTDPQRDDRNCRVRSGMNVSFLRCIPWAPEVAGSRRRRQVASRHAKEHTMTRLPAVVLMLTAACSGGAKGGGAAARDTLTERQRDSILARSSIPGASAVGRAMNAADSASARLRATDSGTPLPGSPPEPAPPLGPFAGIGAAGVGDSLVGAILFDSRLGVRVRPGATARFVAGRARN